jgi:hypothetical protein
LGDTSYEELFGVLVRQALNLALLILSLPSLHVAPRNEVDDARAQHLDGSSGRGNFALLSSPSR